MAGFGIDNTNSVKWIERGIEIVSMLRASSFVCYIDDMQWSFAVDCVHMLINVRLYNNDKLRVMMSKPNNRACYRSVIYCKLKPLFSRKRELRSSVTWVHKYGVFTYKNCLHILSSALHVQFYMRRTRHYHVCCKCDGI